MGHTNCRKAAVGPKLKDHKNYKETKPIKGESQIAFALRAAANLLSPPKCDGESDEIECVDAAADIMDLKDSLEKVWASQPHIIRSKKHIVHRKSR